MPTMILRSLERERDQKSSSWSRARVYHLILRCKSVSVRMGVPLSAAVTLGLLFFLSEGLNEQVAEGCSCTARHPQQMFCDSDTVIRAKITGKVPSKPGYTTYGIKIIETFRYAHKKPFQVISQKSSCNVDLDNKEYLLSGHGQDGRIFVTLCNLVKLWDRVSPAEKVYLSMYQANCDCKISSCTGESCLIKMRQKKCLMRVQNPFVIDDKEALQSICLQSNNGFCSWQQVIVDK